MPIEIKELVIRANVDPGAGSVKKAPLEDLNDKEEIISECVEQILEILRRKEER